MRGQGRAKVVMSGREAGCAALDAFFRPNSLGEGLSQRTDGAVVAGVGWQAIINHW